MTAVPDFGALAGQQNTANNTATNLTNLANRPNQQNAMGQNLWRQNGDGSWQNDQWLNQPNQSLFDSTISGQQGLAGQIGAGLDYSSLGQMPQVGGYNQQVIDAWNALQQPGLASSEAAQRQRLAAQGITNGSNISNMSESNLGGIRNDASNKAILAGFQQGNTEFGQALQARQQGATELGNKYNAALQGSSALTGVRNSLNVNDWTGKVPTSAAYIPQTIYGAAQDTFNANRQNENADIAKSQATTDSSINALRALGGNSGLGGIMSGLGSVGSAASGLWDWGKKQYNTWGQGSDWVTGSGNYAKYAPQGGDQGQYF